MHLYIQKSKHGEENHLTGTDALGDAKIKPYTVKN